MPPSTRLAHQELLRALAGLVVVVDDAVVGRLEAVVAPRLAADREGGEQHVGLAVGRRLVLARVEELEGVARLHPALEVDVVGVDADHLVDQRAAAPAGAARSRRCSDRAARRRLSSSSSSSLVGDLLRRVGTLHVDRRRTCRCRRARPRLPARVSPMTMTRIGCMRCVPPTGEQQDAQLLPFLEPAASPRAPSAVATALASSAGGAELAQDRGDVSPFFTSRCARSRRCRRSLASRSSAAA